MGNWFNITDDELQGINEFTEKCTDNTDYDEKEILTGKSKPHRENSWIRKNKFRYNLVRRFLSVKPNMNPYECYPLKRTGNIIYINSEVATDGGRYCLNHVNHLYMTKRGFIEQYRGRVEWCRDGSIYGIGRKNRDISKITNRRIRHARIDIEGWEILKYSTYKKKYGPRLMDVI